MKINVSRFLRCLFEGGVYSPYCRLSSGIGAATLRRCNLELGQRLRLGAVILLAALLFFNSFGLYAAENAELAALLELDLRDWLSIHPSDVLKQCNSALDSKEDLKEDQICRLYLLRGVAQSLLGKPEDAVRDLTQVLAKQPQNSEALHYRGLVYSALGEFAKARADYDAWIKIQPKSGLAYACLAVTMLQTGHKDDCIRFAEKSIELDPNESLGYLARAEAKLSNSHYRSGLEDLDRCIALSFGDGRSIGIRPHQLRAAFLMAHFDNAKRALPDLLHVRRLEPDDGIVKGMFCEYYFKLGRYNMAFHLSERISTGPQARTDIMAWKVHCLLQRHRIDDALKVAELMIQRDRLRSMNYVCRGEVFFSQGKYKDALQDFDHALSLRPDHTLAMSAKAYLLATCPDVRYRDGRTAKTLATKCCERTEYQVPRRLMLLAMSAAECGDYKEAVRWAKKSVEKADADFPFLKDYRKRLALFESGKAFRFSPDSSEIDYLCP
jgi:tetratricopeptide (TPR) repeat protein